MDNLIRMNVPQANRQRMVLCLTREQLAKKANVSKDVVCKAFRGESISVTTMRQIARALDVDPLHILDETSLPPAASGKGLVPA